MATMYVLRAADRPAERWRNGGGTTWQVAAARSDPNAADFDWRISIAEIAEDGAFSSFPGIDRTIAVIRGAGIRLTVDGAQNVLGPMEPRSFSGDAVTSCELIDGPTLDLNVMTARGRFAGSMVFEQVAGTLQLAAERPGEELVVVLIEGQAAVNTSGDLGQGGAETLARLDAVRAVEAVELTADDAIIAVLRVRRGPTH